MSGTMAQVGIAPETAYGVFAVPTEFIVFNGESMEADHGRIESEALGLGSGVQREDRWAPNPKGASGSIEWEAGTRSMARWLPFLMQTVTEVEALGVRTTTGVLPTPTSYLPPKSFTTQIVRPTTGGTLVPFTYTGCVVTEWEASVDVDGLLAFEASIDAQTYTRTQPAAAATYPADDKMVSWQHGSISVNDVQAEVSKFSIKRSLPLDVERYRIRNNPLKKTPVFNGWEEIEVTFDLDFDDTSHLDRFTAANAEDAVASIDASFLYAGQGIRFVIPSARWDSGNVTVSGPEALTQSITAKVMAPVNGASALTVIVTETI